MTAAPTESTAAASLPGGVAVAPAWDEVNLGSGDPDPHWRTLMDSLAALGPDEFALRVENGRRILREHGVGCFTSDAAGEREVPWDLDFIPFVLPAEEWRRLEAGLVQRARLLDRILRDLYGMQHLVRDGLIPPALVFAHPGYLRACQAVRVPGGRYLHLYAADVARGPDGSWRVLADRTQAPAGLGFAMENRSVLSRVLPEAVQALRPRALGESLRRRRESLRRLAPGPDQPAIALLTPGPRNEAYFEHAYLARLLGFTLVEGADLTVRDRRVFLKTLDGLRPVNVILRRVGDGFCDPLALRGDSLLGVPGLVEAARAGRVAVANALGSGLLESPAFLPFLPALASHVLGEELLLPSVPTWWCGRWEERRYVEEHLDALFLRSAFAGDGPRARPGTLTAEARADWQVRLRERPHECVGQEEVTLSVAPTGDGTRQPVVARLFVLFDGEEYVAVPAGIARLPASRSLGTDALSLIGPTKDVWVLADSDHAPEAHHAAGSVAPVLERLASDLPSRSAENFFWLGRYAERLEQVLRLCRSAVGCLLSDPANGRVSGLLGLIERLGLGGAGPVAGEAGAALQARVLGLLFDAGQPTGVRALVQRLHTASFSVRDRLSADTWRILNRLGADAGERPTHLPLVSAGAVLNVLVLDLAAFNGMGMENMTRGHGWIFLDLGRRIERAVGVAHLVAAALREEARRDLLLEPLLEIADSVMTYRRRYFAEPRLEGVLDLLVLDATNPRALAFQLEILGRHGGHLPAGPNPEGLSELQRSLGQLAGRLDAILSGEDAALATPAGSADWLVGLAGRLAAVSDLLTQVYFSQVLPRLS